MCFNNIISHDSPNPVPCPVGLVVRRLEDLFFDRTVGCHCHYPLRLFQSIFLSSRSYNDSRFISGKPLFGSFIYFIKRIIDQVENYSPDFLGNNIHFGNATVKVCVHVALNDLSPRAEAWWANLKYSSASLFISVGSFVPLPVS
jgi:hypothetical protein